MRFSQALVFVCSMSTGVVLATGPAPWQPGAASSTRAAVNAPRQPVRRAAEVRRLEREVDQQESDSRRAGERLQQQDKTIAELQRQLQLLQSSRPAGQH